MPAVQARQDDCATAADVWRRAYETQQMRQRMYAPVVARFQKEPAPCAQPAVLDVVKAPVALPTFSFSFEASARFAALIQEPYEATDLPPKIKDIQRLVSIRWGVSIADMKSERRDKATLAPRQVAICLCRRRTSRSLPEIGREFGGRDHTTIIHTLNRLKPVMDEIADAIESAPLPYLVDVAYRALCLRPA